MPAFLAFPHPFTVLPLPSHLHLHYSSAVGSWYSYLTILSCTPLRWLLLPAFPHHDQDKSPSNGTRIVGTGSHWCFLEKQPSVSDFILTPSPINLYSLRHLNWSNPFCLTFPHVWNGNDNWATMRSCVGWYLANTQWIVILYMSRMLHIFMVEL